MSSDSRPPIEQVRNEMRALEGRDFQLWSIAVLILVGTAAGFVALVWPNLMWDLGELRLQGRYLPQLIFGFITLVILFNVYALQQRHTLSATREELVRQILRGEAAEQLALMDPLTEVFNRRYLDQLLSKETSRADRLQSNLTFLMIDVDGFKSVNTRFGHLVGDRILTEVARLLKSSCRASDTVIRYGGDEFLVVMGDTDEQQAAVAIERLLGRVEHWNKSAPVAGYELNLSCGTAAYAKGSDVADVLAAADHRMYQRKFQKSTVA